MTPPFGYNLFLMRAMAPPEITLADIYRSILSIRAGHGCSVDSGDGFFPRLRCGYQARCTRINSTRPYGLFHTIQIRSKK